MAGDWIKVEHVTPDKPEVVAIANELGIDQDSVFGKLIRIWIWADQQSLNGHALSVTETFLDRISCHAGFAQAMRKAGWLTGGNGAISLPHFDRHNGETAKARALASKRQSAKRSRSQRDKNVTREEKRRVENTNTNPPTPFEEKSSQQTPFDETPGGLSGAWQFARRGTGRESPQASLEVFEELIRQKYDGRTLLVSILDESRDRTEYLWKFQKRLTEKSGKTADDDYQQSKVRLREAIEKKSQELARNERS